MTSRSKKLMVVATCGALLVAGGLAIAQPGPGGMRGRGGRGGMGGPPGGFPLMRHLDLTEEQRTEMRAIRESHQDEFRALADKMRPVHEALRAAETSVPPDEAQIQARMTELGALLTEGALLRARVYAEVLRLLSAEQLEQMKTHQAERQRRRAEFRKFRDERRRSAPPPEP